MGPALEFSLVLDVHSYRMAPPSSPFPLSELEKRIQYNTVNFKEKRRKARDFDLEECELFELVQYTCTTPNQQLERKVAGLPNSNRMECWPFVRLFRR